MPIGRIAVMILLVGLVAACNNNRGRDNAPSRPLLNLRGSAVPPDEFLVVPQKPLEIPVDLAQLPEPTPGSVDRVTIDTEGQFLAALGGRRVAPGGVPAEDAALVAAARSGAGDTANIRDILRAEDAAFREDRARRIEKLARDGAAANIYKQMLLDPEAELARLRALGIKTPSAPAP